MYEKHFGLTARPFASTAEATAYYPAAGHEQALTRLELALAEQEGYVMLSGPAGVGKTLLARRLLDNLGEQRSVLWLTNPHLPDAFSLYQALLYDLGRPFLRKPEQEMRLELTEHLLEAFKAGRPGLLVIDEGQHLNPVVLEELRLLGNLETPDGQVLQVLLVGQPGLMELLKRPELVGLWQRVAVRAALAPLEADEAPNYLQHLLRAAGGRPERQITTEALALIAERTKGVPRLLNRAAHRAFQLAALAEQAAVDAEAALEALAELGLMNDDESDDAAASLPAAERVWTEEGIETSAAVRPRRLFAAAKRSA